MAHILCAARTHTFTRTHTQICFASIHHSRPQTCMRGGSTMYLSICNAVSMLALYMLTGGGSTRALSSWNVYADTNLHGMHSASKGSAQLLVSLLCLGL